MKKLLCFLNLHDWWDIDYQLLETKKDGSSVCIFKCECLTCNKTKHIVRHCYC